MTNRDDCQDAITCTRRGRGLVSRPGSTCLTPATPGLFRHPGVSRGPDMALKPPTWVPAFAGTTGVASSRRRSGVRRLGCREATRPGRACARSCRGIRSRLLRACGGQGGQVPLTPSAPSRGTPSKARGTPPVAPFASRPVARLRVWVANGRRRWIATSLAADRESARQGYARHGGSSRDVRSQGGTMPAP